MNRIERPTSLPSPLFEKFVVDKQYGVSQITPSGEVRQLVLDRLDSDFFSGSIALTKDTAHVDWLHKLIFLTQKIRALFSRSKQVDTSLCHAMIILDNARPEEKKPHPFLIAHATFYGIGVAARDYLINPDVTELIVYRPTDASIRELYRKYAYTTAFAKKEAHRTDLSPLKNPAFSFWDMATCLFRRKRHAIDHNNVDHTITRRVSYLVADFILQTQIKNTAEQPKALFCTAYAMSVLQGTLLIHGLRNCSMADISTYIRPSCSRDALARKIYGNLVCDNPNDPVGHSLWTAFRENKIANYNSQFAMSAYVGRLLDKLSQNVTPTKGQNHGSPHFS